MNYSLNFLKINRANLFGRKKPHGHIGCKSFPQTKLAYFLKWTQVDPRPLEKAEPISKFVVWVKDSFFHKFEGADFKYDNSLLSKV